MAKTDNRYNDSYNPVIDLPGQQPSSGIEGELPAEEPVRLKPSPRGHRVKPTKIKPENKVKGVQGNGIAEEGSIRKIVEFFKSESFRWICGLALGAFGVYLGVAFLSYFVHCVSDQAAIANTPVGSLPQVGNAGGEGGARLSEFFINESFGLGSFVIIVWLLAVGLKLLIGRPKFKIVNFTIKCIVALITLSLIIGLLTLSFDSPVNWGGYHGRYVNEFIVKFFGMSGGWILCLLLIAIFIVICLRDVINWILRKREVIMERRRKAAEEREELKRKEMEIEEMRRREADELVRSGEARSEEGDSREENNLVKFGGGDVDIDSSLSGYDLEDEPDEPTKKDSEEKPEEYYLVDDHEEEYSGGDADPDPTVPEQEIPGDVQPKDNSDSMVEDNSEANPDASFDSEGVKVRKSIPVSGESKDVPMEVTVNQIARADGAGSDISLIKRMYKFPSPLLLREGVQRLTVDETEQQNNKERIRETLQYHGIPITDIKATLGPTVTLYEIRPEQGVKISKIKNLADDIALSLSAIGVRIIAPMPGKGTVGIEVANAEPQTVSMRTIIQSRKYNETRFRLPVALGCTIGNDIYIADLTKMPHLLVAGATGQGKSVGLNAIIASILYKKRPDEVKFVMIDPKEVEFSLYARLENHYLAKLDGEDAIVTDMSKVVGTLSSLCVEMDERYKLLRKAEVRNIEEYNTKISQHRLKESDGHKFMPYIVLVVDEFADLIMTSGKEVETPIARLAQKARAVGIHVIIATQRPSTNVITGIIKANFPVRIAFKVSSGVDSKTILDATGAQSLIGKGDMLIGNNTDLVRVQCAFIDTPEVEEICNYIARQPFNSGPYILPEPPASSDMDSGGIKGGIGDIDPLFEEVGRMVVASGMGSTSGVQRRFSIGFARAGKIMDQLEHYGVVGPSLGSKPRSVLVDDSGLDMILQTLGNH